MAAPTVPRTGRGTAPRRGMLPIDMDQMRFPPQAGEPVLQTLRAATAQAHRRLERVTGLTSPTLERAGYRHALACLLRVVEPLEAAVSDALPPRLQAFAASRRKAALLRADLICLAADRDPGGSIGAAAARAPDPVRLPRLGGTAAAFGALYVLEGSMLGGMVIAPHVERRLGVSPGACTRYFRAYGEDAGRMWRAWREMLAREVAAGDCDEAILAAVGAFEAFGAAFASPGGPLPG